MDWEELEPAAKVMFRVWTHEGDFQWAQQAWQLLSQTRLTTYGSELERCRVAIRFISLADYYYGFCTTYCSEYLETDCRDWASRLDIKDFHLGQLIGADSSIEDEQKALEHLVGAEDLEPVLEEVFGGRKALFISLLRSSLDPDRNDPQNEDYFNDLEILSRRLSTGEFASRIFMA